MARAAIDDLLQNDSVLTSMGYSQINILATNSVDSVPRDLERFITFGYSDAVRAFKSYGAVEMIVWVHQFREASNDYGEIDKAILRIRQLMNEAVEIQGEDGWKISSVHWLGDSGDLFDDGYKTLCRNSTFRISSHYTGGT